MKKWLKLRSVIRQYLNMLNIDVRLGRNFFKTLIKQHFVPEKDTFSVTTINAIYFQPDLGIAP